MHDPTAGEPGPRVQALWAAGDRARAYGLVVESTKDSLYRYLHHLLRDGEAAQEVFQETYLRVFRALGTFRGGSRLNTWVLVIGRNLALNHLRSKKAYDRRAVPWDESGEPEAPASTTEAPKGINRSLLAALDALPEAQREAVVLFYEGECTVEEIAAATGRAMNTVKSDLHRARAGLRRALAREEQTRGARAIEGRAP